VCLEIRIEGRTARIGDEDAGRRINLGGAGREASESGRRCSKDLVGGAGMIEAAQRDRSRFAELYENNFERVYAYVVRRSATATKRRILPPTCSIARLPTLRGSSGAGRRFRRGSIE